MAIGYSGSPTRGYEVEKCIESIGGSLDVPRRQDVALVGAGKLGRSIIAHFSGRRPKLAIVSAFDNDPAKAGGRVEGCRCSTDIMESTVRDLGIQIAIVGGPAGRCGAASHSTPSCARACAASVRSPPPRCRCPRAFR